MTKEEKTQMNKEKLKALQLTMDKIEKSYGKGSIMRMGDRVADDVPAISSGSIALDVALGIGGYPRGRVVEIYGPESSGKTTLAIHAIAEAQKAGGIAAIVDAEHAFDPYYAQKLGVDIEELLISQPDNGEQALEIVDNLVRSGAVDIVVIDSVAALTPKPNWKVKWAIPKWDCRRALCRRRCGNLRPTSTKPKHAVFLLTSCAKKLG
jgi:recombination protein RecA